MLLLECKPDEVLARRLGLVRREIVHHNDKGRVCNALKRTEGQIGMIDEDPGSAQPPYLATLTQSASAHDLLVMQDTGRRHRVVIVRPRLEEWIIKSAQASGLKMSDFGFSERGNELHREINSKLQKFEELLDALAQAGSERIKYLKSLIG